MTERPVSGEAYTLGDKITRGYLESGGSATGGMGPAGMSPSPSGATPDPGRDPGRLGPAARDRLDALHALAPLAGRQLHMAHVWLFAAADAELDTAAQAHEEQARQLRDRQVVEALRTVYRVLEPTWLRYGPRLLGPDVTLADVLLVAPREQAELAREVLTTAGLDPDERGWPPPA